MQIISSWIVEATWKCSFSTHLASCCKSGVWSLAKSDGCKASINSSISPKNITSFAVDCFGQNRSRPCKHRLQLVSEAMDYNFGLIQFQGSSNREATPSLIHDGIINSKERIVRKGLKLRSDFLTGISGDYPGVRFGMILSICSVVLCVNDLLFSTQLCDDYR